MPYQMTEQEATEASKKLLTLLDKAEKIWPAVSFYFEAGSKAADLKEAIKEYAKLLADSKGYECLF